MTGMTTESLDYFKLVKRAKALKREEFSRTVRVAVMADFAIQQLIPLMRVLAAEKKVWLDVYEANYDGIDFEILDPNSALYKFDPQFVVILQSTEKLKARFYQAKNRAQFLSETMDRFQNLWQTVQSRCSATIVQGNLPLPLERAFGNFELKVEDSLGAFFTDVNYRLAKAVRATKGVLLCDVDFLAASVGRTKWFDARLWHLAKSPCALENLPLLAKSVCDSVLAASGVFKKCLILDLDNTLWGGVIGDDGLSGIQLGEFDEGEAFVAFQKYAMELKRRGIILAVVSKNEHAAAILPFKEHPHMVLKEDDISVFVANWNNKADNIRLIQKTLNIGFDSMVFVDDNPFERNIVREYLPEVTVPEMPEDPAHYIQTLAELNLFETTSFSESDRQRADQYREEAQRELTKIQYTNVDEYLKSLEMKIKLERFNSFNLPRIAQLIQRSNQFNLCTRRYAESACSALMNDPKAMPFTLTLADKFGDYGLISVIILKNGGEVVEIDEYLMSCRVLQRGVESFAMNNIFEWAAKQGAKRVVGRYARTEKNAMVRDFYKGFGFERVGGDDNASEWALDIGNYKPREVFLNPTALEI